jgi:hypothetical protein
MTGFSRLFSYLALLIGFLALLVGGLEWRNAWGFFVNVPRLDRVFSLLHSDPELIDALREQNALLANQSDEWANDVDRAWRTERYCGTGPLQGASMEKPSSRKLREVVAASDGLVNHALLIDAKGWVTAEPFPSYNFVQTDKPKFRYTFPLGGGARDISWLQRSSDGSHVVCWRSETMIDPITNRPIGAVAVEVDYSKVGYFGCREQPIHSDYERATNRVRS